MYFQNNFQSGAKPYIIKGEDTLDKIAEKHGTSIDFLVSLNPHLVPSNFKVGQKILVPHITTQAGCPKGNMPYIVQEGDSLCRIAIKFNVSINQIIRANPTLNPYKILIGQSIYIPKTWEAYSNKDYNVSFMYPAQWKKVNSERYEGKDGFFQVAAIGSRRSMSSVFKHESYGRKRDYGSKPKFITLEIENQSSCLIYPSEDQDYRMKKISALIIKYPKIIRINNMMYNYMILWSNKEYIRQIGSTVSFLVY